MPYTHLLSVYLTQRPMLPFFLKLSLIFATYIFYLYYLFA